MFLLSQYILNKSKQKVSYSVIIGLLFYTCLYLYILFYQSEFLNIFNKSIIYIFIVDLLLSSLYWFNSKNNIEKTNVIEFLNNTKDNENNKDESCYDESIDESLDESLDENIDESLDENNYDNIIKEIQQHQQYQEEQFLNEQDHEQDDLQDHEQDNLQELEQDHEQDNLQELEQPIKKRLGRPRKIQNSNFVL